MKNIYHLFFLFFCSALALAQPANDNCATAQAIGSLPVPSACPAGIGANVVVPGTLNGATAANPYTYQGVGCTGSSTSMASPANDVWYTFTATGYQLNLTIAGTVVNPNVAVYSGTCAALGGGIGGCSVGTAGGNGTLTIQQMVIGTTYFIQVSGNSTAATGTFTMTMNNSIDCNNCLGGSNLTVTPPPTNGSYPAGTTVNFCFKVNSYTQVNTNWLHGVQIAFGSGWNLGSLTTTPPPACQGTGTWIYVPGGQTSSANGSAWPAGFYFDTTDPGTATGDNFGDNCSGNISAANWNFCFSITTNAACSPGSNLSVVINTSGDGESGSWSSNGCTGDPPTNFNAIGKCCPPNMAASSACSGQATGSATTTPIGASGPYTYTWTPSGQNTQTATGLTPGVYTVSVTDADNCLATNTVTVGTLPVPTVTVNNPSVCPGGSVVLNAGGASTYSWTPGGTLSATTGASVTSTPITTTTYTVIGTGANTCTNTATAVVTINPTPTITVNSPTICSGSSVVLNASGASTYTWSPGTGLSATTGASVTANPTVTTTYTITGTSVAGCTATATSTVTIGGSPVLTINSATICAGQQTATLTVNGATTYAWSPATGLSSTTGSVVTGTPGGTTVYTVTGSIGTCTATVTTTITVNPLPTITANTGTICAGQTTATLTANGGITYTWTPATGLSSSNGSPVTANPASTTSYTVSGTDANGCFNSGTTTVTVNVPPTVNVNNATYCTGGSAVLTATGASTYAWSPATGLSATTGASVTANPTVTTNYTVTGTSVGGCVNTATTSVTVVTTPTVTANSATICMGQQTATLTANGAVTYAWSPATGLSATTGSTVTGNPATTTAYTITGTAGTCTATGTATITVNPLPPITVNAATICVGQQTATLTANAAVTYTWTPATGLSSTNGSSVTSTAGATTAYTVVGTDANGCINIATTTVTVNPLPNVTVNSGLICLGASMALNANGAANYAWTPPAGLSATTGASVNANPAVTTIYTVTGTDVNGCVSSAPSTVTVVSNPVITVNTATICLGQQTATLTANGGTTYAWSPAVGLSATVGTSVTATPPATQVYTITGTVGTCTTIGTTTVTVNALPNITAASNSPVCVNGTLNLSSTNGVNYSWNGPNSFSSLAQNPSISSVTVLASGVYTVTGIDANSCVNTATVSVLINPLPVVTATGATVCLNQTINLSCVPNGAASYSWAGPLAFGSNLQNPPIPNATTGMAGSYVVTVTDLNGCVGANVAQVVVNPLPPVASNSGTICGGQTTATLNATGANTYAWSPATGLSSATGASVIANPAATTTYVVTGTDINGCQNTATVTVIVNPPPAVALTQNYSGCAPVCITFSNTASGTGNCSWNFGDGSQSQQCAPSHCFTGQGAYSVTLTLTDNNGCVNSATASVVVYPVPKADFNATPQPTTILESSIHFYDYSSGAAINTWNWTFGDNNNHSSTIQNPVHIYGDTGSYLVQLVVISNFGCRDSTIKIIRIDEDFALYVPNAFSPNSDGTNDTFFAKGFGIKEFKMFIFDRWGEQIFFSDDLNKAWDGRFQGKSDEIVQEDVYVWKIEAKNIKGEKRQMSGTVSLLK